MTISSIISADLIRRGLKPVLLAAVAGLAVAACSPEKKAEAPPPAAAEAPAVAAEGTSIDRMDSALDAVIPQGAVLEKVAGGFGFTEGPVWADGTIRFSDLTGNKLYEIAPDGSAKMILDKSGGKDAPPEGSFQGSNGSVVDQDGSVLMGRHGARDIVRTTRTPDGGVKVEPFLSKNGDGDQFNSPNDMVFAPDGSLWITDPPYGMLGQDKDPAKEAKYNGVYRYKDGKVTAVIKDIPRPNGIGFSPDGKKLYVANCEPDMYVRVYDVDLATGTVSNMKVFISYPKPNPVDVPDGLKVDSAGNVWTSGPGGIRIISPEGKVLGQLKSPDRAQANLAFGGPDFKTAYIMGAGNVYKLKLAIPGQKPLYAK